MKPSNIITGCLLAMSVGITFSTSNNAFGQVGPEGINPISAPPQNVYTGDPSVRPWGLNLPIYFLQNPPTPSRPRPYDGTPIPMLPEMRMLQLYAAGRLTTNGRSASATYHFTPSSNPFAHAGATPNRIRNSWDVNASLAMPTKPTGHLSAAHVPYTTTVDNVFGDLPTGSNTSIATSTLAAGLTSSTQFVNRNDVSTVFGFDASRPIVNRNDVGAIFGFDASRAILYYPRQG